MTNRVQTETTRRRKANAALAALPNYHVQIPNGDLDGILAAHGFRALEEGIYCGREGRISEQVGERTWFTMTWHRMEVTGRYEIVSYLS
jgi:hypothetical protein